MRSLLRNHLAHTAKMLLLKRADRACIMSRAWSPQDLGRKTRPDAPARVTSMFGLHTYRRGKQHGVGACFKAWASFIHKETRFSYNAVIYKTFLATPAETAGRRYHNDLDRQTAPNAPTGSKGEFSGVANRAS